MLPIASRPDPDEVPAWPAVRREELAGVAAAYRREAGGPRQWAGLATGLGGLALSVVLLSLGAHLGWPNVPAPFLLGGGWAVMLASYRGVMRRERRIRARYQVTCPACAAPLLDGTLGRGPVARVDLAVATGNCPACGARILAP